MYTQIQEAFNESAKPLTQSVFTEFKGRLDKYLGNQGGLK